MTWESDTYGSYDEDIGYSLTLIIYLVLPTPQYVGVFPRSFPRTSISSRSRLLPRAIRGARMSLSNAATAGLGFTDNVTMTDREGYGGVLRPLSMTVYK